MADYYQLGFEANKAPWTGEDSTAVIYGGQAITAALPAAVAQNDTLEIVLGEIPAGAKVNGVKWAIGANLGTNTSAVLTLRKKSNNVSSTGQETGTVASAVDRIVQINGANSSVTTTSANNNSATIIPTTFEGLSPAKNILAEGYYLGLKITFGATPTWVTGVNVYASVEAEFIGNV